MKTGVISKRSDYCPLDIFSGKSHRMSRALEALLRCPQNNLKIFKNGNVVYDQYLRRVDLEYVLFDWFAIPDLQKCIEIFSKLIQKALLRTFDAESPTKEDVKLQERDALLEIISDKEVLARVNSDLVAKAKKMLYFASEVFLGLF